jgi:hypothetical protein
MEEERRQLPLALDRKPDDFRFGDGAMSGFLCRGDNKIADRPSLHLGGAPHNGESLRSDARFEPGRATVFGGVHPIRVYVFPPYKSNDGQDAPLLNLPHDALA